MKCGFWMLLVDGVIWFFVGPSRTQQGLESRKVFRFFYMFHSRLLDDMASGCIGTSSEGNLLREENHTSAVFLYCSQDVECVCGRNQGHLHPHDVQKK